MDRDLLFIRAVRENIALTVERANEACARKEIEGLIMVVRVLDMYDDPAKRRCRHKSVHVELDSVGECASEEFQHTLLHRTSEFHKYLLNGKDIDRMKFGRWTKAEAAIVHMQRPLDDQRHIDVLFTIWGSDHDGQNEHFMSLLTNNL